MYETRASHHAKLLACMFYEACKVTLCSILKELAEHAIVQNLNNFSSLSITHKWSIWQCDFWQLFLAKMTKRTTLVLSPISDPT